jgi:hypothetical protein
MLGVDEQPEGCGTAWDGVGLGVEASQEVECDR